MRAQAVYSIGSWQIKVVAEDDQVVEIDFCQAGEGIVNQSSPLTDRVAQQLKEYFQGQRQTFDLPLRAKGTPFQEKVWQALSQIPYGQTRTYKEIAEAIGNPKATRAVGMANNRNPLAIVVPCHRVIGTNGQLTGYAGGIHIKAHLLELEVKSQHLA